MQHLEPRSGLDRSIAHYRKVPKGVAFLGNECGFNLEINEQNQSDLTVLCHLMKLIDYQLDRASLNEVKNKKLKLQVLSCLNTEDLDVLIDFSDDTKAVFSEFLAIVRRLNIKARVIQLLVEIFECDETIKNTTDVQILYHQTLIEGEKTGELTLLFLGENSSKDFEDFIVRYSGVANVFDTLIDIKDDYLSTEVLVAPSIGFRLYFIRKMLLQSLVNTSTIKFNGSLPKLIIKIMRSIGILMQDNDRPN